MNDTPAMPLIRAERIVKDYHLEGARIPVLRGVSLDVFEGETLSIMGASGAGKSTLLHVLGGLDQPSGGRVSYRGEDLYAMPAARRTRLRSLEIAFVFQAYHLLPELDVLENVQLPALSASGALRRMGEIRTRALELLERVGLSQRARHRPLELSGGEQQRAAIARALMNRPRVILADEPTGNLDSHTGDQVLEHLFGLAGEQGRTLVLVTHNEAVAARCRRRLDLRDGLLG